MTPAVRCPLCGSPDLSIDRAATTYCCLEPGCRHRWPALELPPLPTCTSCGAPMRFAQSATTGKIIPFDAVPVPDGTHIIDGTGKARPASDGYEAQPTYVSHFTTCPNAARHSRQRKRPKQLGLIE